MSGHTVPGTEGPRGHELRRPVDDHKIPWRVFGVIGLVLAVTGGIYWFASYENAGTVMLLVAAILAWWVAGYLLLRERAVPSPTIERAQAEAETRAAEGEASATSAGTVVAGEVEAEHYLPHASAWPFVIGLGGAAIAVGIVLGLWVVVPGVAFLALGIVGFVRQTRRRD